MTLKFVNYLGESIKVDAPSSEDLPKKSNPPIKQSRGFSQGARSLNNDDYTGEEVKFELDSIEVIDKDTGYLFFSIAGYQLRLLYVLLKRLGKNYYKLFPMSDDQFPLGSNLLVDFEIEANRVADDLDWLRAETEEVLAKSSPEDQSIDVNNAQQPRFLSLEYAEQGAPTMLFSVHSSVIKARSEFFEVYGSVEPLPVGVIDFGGLALTQQSTVLTTIMQLALDSIRSKKH